MKKMNNTIIKLITLLIMLSTIITSSNAIYNSDIDYRDDPIPLGSKDFYSALDEESAINPYTDNIGILNFYQDTEDMFCGDEQQLRMEMNDRAIIDYTNVAKGYVRVKFIDDTQQRLKATVEGTDDVLYIYNIIQDEWATLPLSDGSGDYTVTVFENVFDNKYRAILTKEIDVRLCNELAPFLVPNQYVNLAESPKTIMKAAELTVGAKTTSEKISRIYNYVVNTLCYDDEKAENVKPGYLPNLDEILDTKTGICLDYAALMAGMLRSQNIPCRIVVGYAGNVYHAWISVYVEEEMTMICGMYYYDEEHWLHMDPTFASGNQTNRSALEYINNGENYSRKYFY